MEAWSRIASLTGDYKKVNERINAYSYEDKDKAMLTDEKVCSYLVRQIREVKNSLFNAIELLYEVEKREPVSDKLAELKDELDIFSDEIKARHCDWKGLDEKWMVNLIKHDWELIDGLEKLNLRLQKMYEKVLGSKAITSGSEEHEEALRKYIMLRLPDIESRVDDLVRAFKEREGICNIRPLSLEKTFEKVKERIERQI